MSVVERPGFERERYASLLRALLGPTLAMRDAADSLLGSFAIWERIGPDGLWAGRLRDALDSFGDERSRFLRALVAHWANRSLAAWGDYSVQAGLPEPSAPRPRPPWHASELDFHPLEIRIDDPPPDWLQGNWTGAFLAKLGPVATPCVDLLTGCLEHPSGLVVDRAIEALGSVGPGARSALPALLTRLRTSGRDPALVSTIIRIVDENASMLESIAREIDPLGGQHQIAGACAVLADARVASPALVDTLFEKFGLAREAGARAELLSTGAGLARRTAHDCDRWRSMARSLVDAREPDLLGAAAVALAAVGTADEDWPRISFLAESADWDLRCYVYDGLSNWEVVPIEALQSAARDLTCFDGHDDQPSANAHAALVRCGERAAPVMDALVRWARETASQADADTEYPAMLVLELVESLGPRAMDFRDVLVRLDEALRGDGASSAPEAESEPAEETDPEPPSPSSDLARTLGFPLDRSIPGSLGDPEWIGADDQAVARVRRLLERIDALD